MHRMEGEGHITLGFSTRGELKLVHPSFRVEPFVSVRRCCEDTLVKMREQAKPHSQTVRRRLSQFLRLPRVGNESERSRAA